MFTRMDPNDRGWLTGVASRLCATMVGLGSLCFVAACAKDAPPPQKTIAADSVVAIVPPVDSPPPLSVRGWNGAEGPAVYLPGEGGVAQVVLPPIVDDSVPRPSRAVVPAEAAPATIDLFAPSGLIARVAVGEFVSTAQPEVAESCDAWPVVPIRESAAAAQRTWRVALKSGVADPLTSDSIGGMARADSSQLSVDISRAVATLASDTSGVLRQIPFGVRKAHRIRLADGTDVVLAVVERRLNVEASPRVERTVVLLESQKPAKGFKVAWHTTQFATEDELIAVDLLGAVILRSSSQPTVFLSQDFGDGSRIQMLQRVGVRLWALRWSSAYTGC
jgi:hypothetical protein